jgi:ferredoxin
MSRPLRLRVDPIACSGHGLCADLLPELVELDEWGYPIIRGPVTPRLTGHARRAVRACPALALSLRLEPDPARHTDGARRTESARTGSARTESARTESERT